MEPGDLWTRYMEPAFADRAPHVEQRDGIDYLVYEGRAPISLSRQSAMRSAHLRLNEDGWQDTGGWEPARRLKDQALDGVAAEVIYPTIALGMCSIEDIPFQKALFRAYNDWMADFCSYDPARLVGLALLCVDDVAWSVAELERTRGLGLRGAHIPMSLGPDLSYTDAAFDPLWACAAGLDMPLAMHAAGTRRRLGPPQVTPLQRVMGQIPGSAAATQQTLTEMLIGGVFGRHPDLKVVSAENDLAWVPYFAGRLAHDFPKTLHFVVKDFEWPYPKQPVDYLRENVYFTFEDDPAGVHVRDYIGVDRIMWASDYPHEDSTWPNSREVLERNFRGVDRRDRELITHHNAAALYGLS
jgi:predicted TIM-barrel fold metal-dependent hydrolase